MNNKTFNSALILLMLLYTPATFAVPLPPTPKPAVSASEIAKMEAAAKEASKERAELEAKAQKIKTELGNVNQKMIAAAKKIQNGEDEVRKKQEELEVLQQHLSESEAAFNTDHSILVETLSALQNLALRPSEAILAQPLTPVEVMRSSILMRSSIHSLKERAESIRQGIEDINTQKAEIAMRLKDLEQENQQLAQQHNEMKELSKQKSEMYNQISSQSKEAKERAEQLASQASGLRDLLDKLEKQKELQRKQLAEKERLSKQRAADDLRKERQEAYIPPAQKSINFASAKGKLARPARGPIVTTFNQELSKGVKSNGIDIKTAANAQIIAPYDGTIIFAGPFKNFANLVIIDHGDGYTSLLSGMGDTDTEVGQTILAGEPVGTMDSSGTMKLHMEIRKNNHPVNPSDWLSMK